MLTNSYRRFRFYGFMEIYAFSVVSGNVQIWIFIFAPLWRSPYFSPNRNIMALKKAIFALFCENGFLRHIFFANGAFYANDNPYFRKNADGAKSPISDGPISGGLPSWVRYISEFPQKFGFV